MTDDIDPMKLMNSTKNPDELSPFGADIGRCLSIVSQRINFNEVGNIHGMPPEMAFNLISPVLASQADERPELTKRLLAILSLEARAIVTKHDERPIEQIAQEPL